MARNLLSLLGFCFSVLVFTTNVQASQEQMRVSATTMQAVPFAPSINILGSVVARNEIVISPSLTQHIITDVLVEEGDHVKQGDVLATLETPIQDEKVKQARANLEQALALIKQNEAMNDRAQSDLKRVKPLIKTGVIAASEFEKYKMEANSALAALNAAKAEYRQLQAQLQEEKSQRAKTTILAPKAGIISERAATVGMTTDGNYLFKLIDNNQYEFSAEAYISDLKQIQVGSSATISLTEGDKITGKVRYVSPKINPITQIGLIRITLDNAPANIKLGDFGYALFQLKPENINAIPYSAVSITDGNKADVYIVGKNNAVEKKQVNIGRIFDKWVEIKSGLSANDKVVVSASPFLQEMDTVSIKSQGK
ncbi:efflux RND transporter periplasmic adaptor subunit [Xenorhabdus cabanillasii]|uniref:RND family efflux transporter MFP subunit n=2 Tax=Xenorhabdus cabanillasii TaxID=351673 RepID=A0A3D9USE7_9GAMM|nr:efflux RND transporter periplasmic adaptor subunit [Xenorhabdus cabanillasii]PHM78157.1 multidrug resistance protein MdtE [Xenorhabdus cabanillasii JM26]REF28914.1 RND family efflux transporter MFP subunit [Xenorhabdus cabanillasii]CDL79439.1 putative transport transmembrane protein [Xenorhabdus cabanillasii JM26]